MNVCYCSTKLAKVIGIKTKPEIPLATPPTSTGHWNAHLFYYGPASVRVLTIVVNLRV